MVIRSTNRLRSISSACFRVFEFLINACERFSSIFKSSLSESGYNSNIAREKRERNSIILLWYPLPPKGKSHRFRINKLLLGIFGWHWALAKWCQHYQAACNITKIDEEWNLGIFMVPNHEFDIYFVTWNALRYFSKNYHNNNVEKQKDVKKRNIGILQKWFEYF